MVTVVGSGAVGQLDGPKREIVSGWAIGTELAIFAPAADPYGCLSYDPKLDRVHFVAGSARGYLDGPFSRARFGGHSYSQQVRSARAGHLYYRAEPENGDVLRCLDFKKQEVKTIARKTKYIGGMVTDSHGRLYIKERYGPNLEIISPDGSSEIKTVQSSVQNGHQDWGGFSGLSMTMDEKNCRIYASGYRGMAGWYVWYWDLKDYSFHGVLPMPGEGQPSRKQNEAGPFEGTSLYDEMRVFFGQDDPEKRFLYVCPNDTHYIFRLDLMKKEIWTCGVVGDKIRFVNSGVPGKFAGWTVTFTEDGDLISDIPSWNMPRVVLYKRL